MPLVGGGGAGNTAGSNPAGTGTTLNLIRTDDRTYAYAYSGSIASSGTDFVMMLSFTTGAYTSILKWSADYFSNSGDNAVFRGTFNGEEIMGYFVNGGVTSPSDRDEIDLVIPPYTTCLFEGKNSSNNDTIYWFARLTGRVYE